MNANTLHARDNAERKRLGWPCGFIAPRLPKPKTDAEKFARRVFDAFPDTSNAVTLHVYDVLEMLEYAYEKAHEK